MIRVSASGLRWHCQRVACSAGGQCSRQPPEAPVGVLHREPGRYGASGSGRAGTRIVGCSSDKPMLLISSEHEKQTAVKPRASRDREFLSNEQQ